MSPNEFLKAYGSFDPIDVAGPDASTLWWGSGEPLQVLAGIDQSGTVVVAHPVGLGSGPCDFHWVADATVLVDRSAKEWQNTFTIEIERIVKLRRKTFCYCRICRTTTGPENRNAFPNVCDGCAPQLGVVF